MILSQLSLVLCVLGYPVQALARSREALAAARPSGPHTLALALSFAAELNRDLRDERAARELTQALRSLAAERGFSLWSAQAAFLWGAALIAEGQLEEGIAEITRAAASYEMTGGVTYSWRLLLAEAQGRAGRPQSGHAAIGQALEQVEKTGIRLFEAEMYRVKGELTLIEGATAAAESAFRHAIGVARGQSAKSWELRATISLARLLKGQRKTEEARQMLSEIYGWFTEGFDTADLKDARALLDELAQ